MTLRKFAKLPRSNDQICPICNRQLQSETKVNLFLRTKDNSNTKEKSFDLPFCDNCKLPFCDDRLRNKITAAFPGYFFQLINVHKNDNIAEIIKECELKEVKNSGYRSTLNPKDTFASVTPSEKKKNDGNNKNPIKNNKPMPVIQSDKSETEGRSKETVTSVKPSEKKEKDDKIVNLIKNKNPMSPIQFDEFEKEGWNEDTFLQYLQRCETVRAALITIHTVSDLDSYFVKNIRNDRARNIGLNRIKEDLVELALKKLLLFLQDNAEFEFTDLNIPVKYLMERLCYKLNIPEDEKTQILFKHMDDFRCDLENAISIGLKKGSFEAPLSYEMQIKQRKLTDGRIKTLIHELQNELNSADKTRENLSGRHLKSLIALREWARKAESYVNLREKERDLEILKRQTDGNQNNARMFVQARDILYIYNSNSIICLKDKHDLIDVTCIVKLDSSNGSKAEINAKYCPQCRKFLIHNTSYEQYMKRYKFLPVIFEDYDASVKGGWNGSLQNTSPLSRMGYSVDATKGYQASYRQRLLKTIIDMGIMRKRDVIKYLEQFIEYNGRKSGNEKAVIKWKNDLDFVNNYEIDKQATGVIRSVKKYRK